MVCEWCYVVGETSIFENFELLKMSKARHFLSQIQGAMGDRDGGARFPESVKLKRNVSK